MKRHTCLMIVAPDPRRQGQTLVDFPGEVVEVLVNGVQQAPFVVTPGYAITVWVHAIGDPPQPVDPNDITDVAMFRREANTTAPASLPRHGLHRALEVSPPPKKLNPGAPVG